MCHWYPPAPDWGRGTLWRGPPPQIGASAQGPGAAMTQVSRRRLELTLGGGVVAREEPGFAAQAKHYVDRVARAELAENRRNLVLHGAGRTVELPGDIL